MGARPSSFGATAPPPVAPARQWSPEQQAIHAWFRGEMTAPHLVIDAGPGCGKTTTTVGGVNQAPEQRILMCAFNKGIAQTLNEMITNPRAEAKTLHALGMQAIGRKWRGIPVASPVSKRQDELTDKVLPTFVPKPIRKLVGLLHTKGREIIPVEPTEDALVRLAVQFGLEPDESWRDYDIVFVASHALAAMTYAADHPPRYDVGIDFADMIYLPLAWNLLGPTFDLVVLDEGQDASESQLEIIRRVAAGRICIVGDPFQTLYTWRGSAHDVLNRAKASLGAASLPLKTSYRCCQAVLRRAQGFVPDLQAHPSNPEGIVAHIDYTAFLEAVQPGDYVLSRLNAPLVSLTLYLLRNKVRARMAGRDVGAGILNILKRLKVEAWTPLEDMLARLDSWERKTVNRYANMGMLEFADTARDQAGMLRALAEDAESMRDVLNNCTYLFTDVPEEGQVVCSSAHRAKGTERDRVFMLTESLYRRGVTFEEQCIDYVMTTRARVYLGLVTGVPSLQPRQSRKEVFGI